MKKAKTEKQVCAEIIAKIERFSGKTMTEDERNEWHDYLIHEQFSEVTRRFFQEVMEMSPKIKFTNR